MADKKKSISILRIVFLIFLVLTAICCLYTNYLKKNSGKYNVEIEKAALAPIAPKSELEITSSDAQVSEFVEKAGFTDGFEENQIVLNII